MSNQPGQAGIIEQYVSKTGGVLIAAIKNNVQYRFAYLSGSVSTSFSILFQVLFWNGVYRLNHVESVAGYNQAEMLSYIVVAQIINRLVHPSDTFWKYSNDIRSGDLNAYLLRPVSYYQFRLGMLVGGRIVDTGASLLPFVVVLLIMSNTFVISWTGVLLAMPVIAAALFLYFNVDCFIGTLAFWLEHVSGIVSIKFILFGFLGGRFFPLELLPGWVGALVKVLPFSYLVYYPAQIVSGRILAPRRMLEIFVLILVWAFFFFGLGRFVWSRGLKRYSALGG